MEQLLKEFGLYDVVGHIIPGAVLLWLLSTTVGIRLPRQSEASSKVTGVSLFLMAAFVLGNLFQGVGSLVERHYYRPQHKRTVESRYSGQFHSSLTREIEAVFGKVEPDRQIDLCQTYCQVRGIDSYISIMRGRYGFFRGLCVGLSFALAILVGSMLLRPLLYAAVCLAAVAWWGMVNEKTLFQLRLHPSVASPLRNVGRNLLATIGIATLIWLCYGRFEDFDRYFTDHVYRTFLVDRMAKPMAPGGG